jgi:chromosome segregation protein
MEDFTKVKSGISGLRKERDQLKASYDVLTRQLENAVSQNAAAVRSLSSNAQSFSASLAAIDGKVSGAQEKAEGALSLVRAETAAIRKRLEDHKNTLIDLGERVKRSSDSFQTLSKEISEARRSEKETEKALQGVGAALSGATGKIAAISSSVEGRMSSIDQKHSSALTLLRKDSDAQSSVLKGHDTAVKSMTLSLQDLKKDISATQERMQRLRESTISNSKKLEAVGTLESKIAHIESVKSGLVRGVESLKDIRMDMAALKQKTKDLDLRLTGADKTLDGKIGEKTDVLDGRLSEKTAAMEGEMQERLKFLEATLTAKEKAIEASISADLDAMGRSVAREIADMKKVKETVKKTESEMRVLRSQEAALRAAGAEDKKDMSAMAARIGTLEDLRGRVTEIEKAKDAIVSGIAESDALKQKVGILSEKYKSFEAGTSSGMTLLRTDAKKWRSDAARMEKDMSLLKKTIDAGITADVSTLKAAATKNSAAISKSVIEMAAVKKDVAAAGKLVTALKAEHAGAKRRVAALERLSERVKSAEDSSKALAVKVEALAPLSARIAALAKDVTVMKTATDNSAAVLEEKMGYNVASIRRESAMNAASLKKMQEDVKKISVDLRMAGKDITAAKSEARTASSSVEERILKDTGAMRMELTAGTASIGKLQAALEKLTLDSNSMKKDISAGASSGTKLSGDVSGLLKKSQELEKIQVRLSEMEKGKESLMAALEEKLAERIAFLQKSAKQGAESLAAMLTEKAGKMEEKAAASAASMKKETAAVSSSVEKLNARMDALQKLQQKVDSLAVQGDALSKGVSSLQELKVSASKTEQKGSTVEKDFREFRAATESTLSELMKGVETARVEGRDKFGTAVKAFLGAKTELSGKVGMMDVKVSETGRRLDELSRALARIDALERKMDRLSDKGADIRRDVDQLSRKGAASDKVMLVDLGKEDAES